MNEVWDYCPECGSVVEGTGALHHCSRKTKLNNIDKVIIKYNSPTKTAYKLCGKWVRTINELILEAGTSHTSVQKYLRDGCFPDGRRVSKLTITEEDYNKIFGDKL